MVGGNYGLWVVDLGAHEGWWVVVMGGVRWWGGGMVVPWCGYSLAEHKNMG